MGEFRCAVASETARIPRGQCGGRIPSGQCGGCGQGRCGRFGSEGGEGGGRCRGAAATASTGTWQEAQGCGSTGGGGADGGGGGCCNRPRRRAPWLAGVARASLCEPCRRVTRGGVPRRGRSTQRAPVRWRHARAGVDGVCVAPRRVQRASARRARHDARTGRAVGCARHDAPAGRAIDSINGSSDARRCVAACDARIALGRCRHYRGATQRSRCGGRHTSYAGGMAIPTGCILLPPSSRSRRSGRAGGCEQWTRGCEHDGCEHVAGRRWPREPCQPTASVTRRVGRIIPRAGADQH